MDVDQQQYDDLDDRIVSFMEIAGSKNLEEARYFLEASSGDLERAINIYFTRGVHSLSVDHSNVDEVVVINGSNSNEANKNAKTDNKRTGKTRISVMDDEEDKVRDPIAPISGTLVPHSFHETYRQRNGHREINPIFEQYHDQQMETSVPTNGVEQGPAPFPAGSLTKRGRYNIQVPIEATKNGHIKETKVLKLASSSKESSSKSNDDENKQKQKKDLASLFRPPVDLTYRGDWEGALRKSRSLKRWLLVNIQNSGEFASQVLNRDVWSMVTVRELVKENFVLWQVYHTSSDGVRICGYYNIAQFPSIFIIDPRTGEEILQLRAPDAVSFCDQLTSFLDDYPDFDTFDNQHSSTRNDVNSTRLKHDSTRSNEVMPQKDKGEKRKHILDTNSSNENENDIIAEQQAKRMRRVVTISDDTRSSASTSQPQSPLPATVDPNEWLLHIAQTPPTFHQAPSTSTATKDYNITLRLPDSQRREYLTLWGNTKLRVIFSFLCSLGIDPLQHSLVASYPKRTFSLDDSEISLEQAGLSYREMLHVEKN